MASNAWFPLTIRAIGLFFLISPATRLVDTIAWFITLQFDEQSRALYGRSFYDLSSSIPMLIAYCVHLAIAIYLLLGAPAIVRWCLREAARRCPCCDQLLPETPAPSCPACGCSIPPRAPQPSAAQNPST